MLGKQNLSLRFSDLNNYVLFASFNYEFLEPVFIVMYLIVFNHILFGGGGLGKRCDVHNVVHS